MLKILLKHKVRLLLVFLLVFLLVLVRAFENQLFYDPFLNYYRGDFSSMALPQLNWFYFFISLTFRYGLNMLISLAMIYVLFKEKEIVKFTAVLYLLFFVILFISLWIVMHFFPSENKMLLFYIRRFLIHPLFVLLFIPAFYFQRVNK